MVVEVVEEVKVAPAPPRQQEAVAPPRPGKEAWTAQELLSLPDDGHHYELVRGELVMMTPASARHGKFSARLIGALEPYVRDHGLGEVYTAEPGFVLATEPDTVRVPDVAFVRRERIPPEGEPEGFWPIAPDLVVEVVSPSESAPLLHSKVADYLRAGTRLIWVIYPDTQTVMEFRSWTEVRVLTVEESLDGGDVVPGFSLPLARLFA